MAIEVSLLDEALATFFTFMLSELEFEQINSTLEF